MTDLNVQVLFEASRAVLKGFAEGRAPDAATQMAYEQQHDRLEGALRRLETVEADRLADTIFDLRGSIRDVHEGLRPNPELAAEVEARLRGELRDPIEPVVPRVESDLDQRIPEHLGDGLA